MDNWNPAPVFVDGKYITYDTWYDADGSIQVLGKSQRGGEEGRGAEHQLLPEHRGGEPGAYLEGERDPDG